MGTQVPEQVNATCAMWEDNATAVRTRGSPSVLLSVLVSAPPHLSSLPASPPTRFEVADVVQNPWPQHLGDSVVLPTVKDRHSQNKTQPNQRNGCNKFLPKHSWREQQKATASACVQKSWQLSSTSCLGYYQSTCSLKVSPGQEMKMRLLTSR